MSIEDKEHWESPVDRWKKNFKNKKKNKKPIDDALDALSTLDEKSEEIRKKTIKRVLIVALSLSVGLFIVIGLVKTFYIIYHTQERKPIKTKVEKVKLQINTYSKWQEQKDEQISELDRNIKKVNKTLTKKIQNVKHELKQDINATTNTILSTMQQNQASTRDFLTNSLNELKEAIKNSEKNSKKYADIKAMTVEQKIKQIKQKVKNRSSIDFSKLSLPKLPSYNKKSKKFSKIATLNSSNNKKEKIEKIPTVEEEASVEVVNDEKISTLDSNTTKKVKNKLPAFTIMPGFTKGTIITGANVPTLSQAQSSPVPLWISFNGDTLIANGDTMDVGECILQASATGNFASGVAEIRLSRISCSATDEKGQKYKILSNVKGWVYSENGQYGLKGRLVSKEGKIISKAIPLTILEGLIQSLSNIGSNNTYSYTTGNNAGGAFAKGATKSSTKVLGKLSDYYLKILESLNPVIEIKAGREVTIAFNGGEQVKFEKYTPADVEYFQNEEGD